MQFVVILLYLFRHIFSWRRVGSFRQLRCTKKKKKKEGDDGGMVREFPIYVCVPENEVASVIDSCPPEKREDLVFLQSGCLEPLLKSRGLCRNDQTQATLFFSVDKVGTVHSTFYMVLYITLHCTTRYIDYIIEYNIM